MLTHALTDRLERLESRWRAVRHDAHAFGGTVVDGDGHRRLAPSPVIVVVRSVPHIVSTLRECVMVARAARRSDARWGEKIVLSREPQHPAF
jgi:hypothetical protein